jgi:hypothetical protein
MDWSLLDWLAVLALGSAVGASELVSRYKDDPWAAIRTWPAVSYIAINGVASASALGLVHANHLFEKSHWIQILLAGVSSMAFFRTSLFVVRAGDRDIGVGPSGFLQIFLGAADRDVDRRRAASRAKAVADAMMGVDFNKAKDALPPYCLALMQGVTREDQQELVRAIEDLGRGPAGPSVKALLLGIELMNVVGVDVLTTAVNSLRDQISVSVTRGS